MRLSKINLYFTEPGTAICTIFFIEHLTKMAEYIENLMPVPVSQPQKG